MKKLLSLLLVLALLLCGCGGNGNGDEPTEKPTEAPTTEAAPQPTETETEPETEPEPGPQVYTNPLTGQRMDNPVDSRVFAVTINNVSKAVPHYGVSQADLYFEMFINGYATRGLALYSDISKVSDIGSVRSVRFNFIDICQSFDAVLTYCGGSSMVLSDLHASGVDSIYAEADKGDFHYRDEARWSAGYSREHCLFVKGPELMECAKNKGYSITQDPNKDYGMIFAEQSSAVNGETADTVKIDFSLHGQNKTTTMVYDPEVGQYVYNQYGKEMTDPKNGGQKEYFRNVIVILCPVANQDVYHVADLVGSGEGYFACDGKIIPILWSRSGDNDTFHYTLTDGTPLTQGIGSSYIAIAPLKSPITWK